MTKRKHGGRARELFKARARWSLELFIAAIAVLALIQLHGDIVRVALYQLGVGIEGATLLAARDRCDNLRLLPPALSDLIEEKPNNTDPECARQQDLWVARAQGDDVVLFVNGALAHVDSGSKRLSVFPAIQLREGNNWVAVYSPDAELFYPYAWDNQSGNPVVLTEDDTFLTELYQRPNSILVQVPSGGETHGEIAEATRRTLEVIRAPDGTVQVSASACLAPEDPVLGWAHDSAVLGPEFVGRVFKTVVMGPPVAVNAPRWKQQFPVHLISEQPTPSCTQVTTEYSVPDGLVMSMGGFVPAQDDLFIVEGFSGKLMNLGRSPSAVDDDRFIWRETPARQSIDAVMIVTIPDTDRPAVPLPEMRQEAQTDSTLFLALRNLEKLLPQLLRPVFWGLAAVVPVGLILWAMQGYVPSSRAAKQRIRSARQGVLALFVFMLAFALQPLIVAGTRTLLAILPSLPTVAVVRTSLDFYAPLSVLTAFLVVSVLRANHSRRNVPTYWFRRILAALSALIILVVGFVALMSVQLVAIPTLGNELLNSLYGDWQDVDITALGVPKIALTGGIVAAWFLVCLMGFWIPLYWLFRIAVPSGSVVWATIGSSLIVLLLPLAAALGDLISLTLAFSRGITSFGIPAMLVPYSHTDLPPMAAMLAVTAIIAVVLRAFREITAEMLSASQKSRFRAYTGMPYLLGLTVLIVWPLLGVMEGEAELVSSATVRLVSVFQAYGVLLALLGPLAVWQELDHASAELTIDERFNLSHKVLIVATAAFAGYLTLWSREPISVFIVIVAGWFVFRHLVLKTYIPLGATASSSDLVRRFASFLHESQMLKARRRALEKKFAAGDLAEDVLRSEREGIDSQEGLLQQTLGLTPGEARQRLFGYGPSSSPLKNGVIGAVAGLIMAGVVQLLLPFDLAIVPEISQSGWLDLVEKILVDPQYRVVEKSVKGSHLLVLVNETLNAVSIWVVTGFLFGYVFHVVRGHDGFGKAVFFGLGIVIPYMLVQVLAVGGGTLSIASLTRVVPLLLFLLILGVLVFDGMVLRKQGVELSKLPTIYGLRSSIGYISFASGLAALQPLLELIGWLRA